MRLALRGRGLELRPGFPALMGIVNATPDSFSDSQGHKDPGRLAQRALALVGQGAEIVDVGGQSGRTDRPAVSEAAEAARIVPVIRRLASEGVAVSVDTWRAGPAAAALEAGAAMINDVSGLAEPALASLCADSGAALVITHTRSAPKVKAFPGYEDVVADVAALLGQRAARAREAGVADDALLLDPGIDLAKTPAQSVEVLRRLPELYALGRPLLLAVSRKDFVGAITGRLPVERGPGTLAALEPALDAPGAVVRVHDIAGARDFISVRAALRGHEAVTCEPLAEDLRRGTPG
ncbi:MAG: dihydropteroate synthase [Thermoleophilaceae bacterium]